MPPIDPAPTAPVLDEAASANWQRGALGLSLTPLVVGVAAAVLPRIHLGDASASIVVYAGAASTSLAALAIAAGSYPTWKWRLATIAVATMALAVAFWERDGGMAAPIAVSASLVAAAWAIGTSSGRRIEHPGH